MLPKCRYICPICEKKIYSTIPHVATTPWVDTCGCCDQNFCLQHRADIYSMPPNRPSDEEMEKRALERAKANEEYIDKEIIKIKEKYKRLERLANLCLEIKEYFGWTFDTFEEFKIEMQERSW